MRSEKDPKFVYYLSAEFLMGRSLMNAIQNLELTGISLLTHNLCTLLVQTCHAPPESENWVLTLSPNLSKGYPMLKTSAWDRRLMYRGF